MVQIERPHYVQLRDISTEAYDAASFQHEEPSSRTPWSGRPSWMERRSLPKIPRVPRLRRPRRWRSVSGWRFTTLMGAVTAFLALVTNIILLGWASSKPRDGITGDPSIFQGSCDQMQTTFTWSHLAINVLSSLLLASSNYAIQCLSAPTRTEVDRAHEAPKFLDIGISGRLNWEIMPRWRQWLWIFFVLTSLPLHLL